MSDVITGPVTDSKQVIHGKLARKPELYTGEPPQSVEGKIPQVFNLLRQKCGIEEIDLKTKKKIKCNQQLQVLRVKNQVFEWDDAHAGGQLIYDEKDMRQYVVCPLHGGLKKAEDPSWQYDRWEPGSKL